MLVVCSFFCMTKKQTDRKKARRRITVRETRARSLSSKRRERRRQDDGRDGSIITLSTTSLTAYFSRHFLFLFLLLLRLCLCLRLRLNCGFSRQPTIERTIRQLTLKLSNIFSINKGDKKSITSVSPRQSFVNVVL